MQHYLTLQVNEDNIYGFKKRTLSTLVAWNRRDNICNIKTATEKKESTSFFLKELYQTQTYKNEKKSETFSCLYIQRIESMQCNRVCITA